MTTLIDTAGAAFSALRSRMNIHIDNIIPVYYQQDFKIIMLIADDHQFVLFCEHVYGLFTDALNKFAEDWNSRCFAIYGSVSR